MEKCPNCKSTRIYQVISICAKQSVNTGRIYGLSKHNEIDNAFDPYYCEKCGWTDSEEYSTVNIE